MGLRQSRKLSARQDLHLDHPENISDENWDFTNENTQYLLHQLHSYPARFIPQIPKRAISRWSKPGDLVLDPFCGSGTTLLESAFSGRNSIGIDNNSVAFLISQAKITRYTNGDFNELKKLIDIVEQKNFKTSSLSEKEKIISFIPDYANFDKWFETRAANELGWLKLKISELGDRSKLLALSVFSMIVLSASKQDSDTHYVSIDRCFKDGYAIKRWILKMKKTIDLAKDTSPLIKKTKQQVYKSDSRNMSYIEDDSVNLIVTSPPYLNAYDYHKYHRHRIHWIDGDVAFSRDNEIGKHDVFTRKNATPDLFFKDIETCMAEWKRVLLQNGKAFVIIGDSIVNHKFVSVGDKFVELAENTGLTLEQRWIRTLSSVKKSFNHNARIKREHLLLFTNLE